MRSPVLSFKTSLAAFAAAAILGAAAVADDQNTRLVFDSETRFNAGARIQAFTEAGGLVYMSIDDPVHGEEIWRTDGTTEGTFLLADLCPGPCDGLDSGTEGIPPWLEFGEWLVFRGGTRRPTEDDPALGLWVSDGSPGPPVRIVDRDVFGLTPLSDRLVFFRRDSSRETRLLVTDGTRAGTRVLIDEPISPSRLTAAGDSVFFTEEVFICEEDVLVDEVRLWRTDGTPEGTRVVLKFDGFSQIDAVTAVGDRALVRRRSELWVSDGTLEGTVLIFSPDDAEIEFGLQVAGERVFFVLNPFNGSRELWSTDGTAAGTQFAGQLGPNQLRVFSDPTAVAGGRLFYLVRTLDSEYEMWSSDGTPAGTSFLLALPGLTDLLLLSEDPLFLTAAGDRVFFFLPTEGEETELWTSDGSLEGTVRVAGFEAAGFKSPQDLVAAGRDVFFTRRTLTDIDQLWRSDGTSDGTVVVYEQEAGDIPLFDLWGFFAGKLYVDIDDGEHGREPWVSDGTPEGTHLLADIGGVASGVYPENLAPTDDLLFFRGSDNGGEVLWASDGTADGTRRILPETLRPSVLVSDDDAAYLMDTFRRVLWRTDGTGAGTMRLQDDFRSTRDTAFLNGVLYLLVRDGITVLWRTDGTIGGTVKVAEISTDFAFASGEGLFTAGDSLVFTVPRAAGQGLFTSDGTFDGTTRIEMPFEPSRLWQAQAKVYFEGDGTELWETDGSAAGTRRVLTYREDLPSVLVLDVGVASSRLWLVAVAGQVYELWTSDGTPGNAVRVATLPSRPHRSFDERYFVARGEAVFFTLKEPETGAELWHADTAGARRVADLCPGRCSSLPQHPRVIRGLLYFAASDGVTGLEPWVSDGTARGTFQLADIAPGPPSSDPSGFTRFQREVYFRATDPASGTELWATRGGVDCRETAERACLLDGRFEVEVRWRNQHADGAEGVGRRVPFSDQTALFWFFGPSNLELAVKLLDGRDVNGRFWFFSGGLSDIEYEVEVTDRETGETKTYHKPPGEICGLRDLNAFDPVGAKDSPGLGVKQSACVAGPRTLCLLDGRFQVEVEWRTADREGPGMAQTGTDATGFFWFFSPRNLELIVKALDGRAVNGHFWVFYGALTGVEFQLTVTDTVNGARRVYHSPEGATCGRGDIAAF